MPLQPLVRRRCRFSHGLLLRLGMTTSSLFIICQIAASESYAIRICLFTCPCLVVQKILLFLELRSSKHSTFLRDVGRFLLLLRIAPNLSRL